LIYIAKVNPFAEVNLIKNKQKINSLKGGAWIGTIEYCNHKMNDIGAKMTKWDVNAEIITKERGEDNKVIMHEDVGVYFYFIDLLMLDELEQDTKYPLVFKNAIQAIWLMYTTNYIIEQDKAVFKNVKKMLSPQNTSRKKTGERKYIDYKEKDKDTNNNYNRVDTEQIELAK